jgi:hypothetical protein
LRRRHVDGRLYTKDEHELNETANVLDTLPKNRQPAAKAMPHEVWVVATRADASKAFERFVSTFGAKWPKATDCVEKDRERLLAFYDFPAEHRRHLISYHPALQRERWSAGLRAAASASPSTGPPDRSGPEGRSRPPVIIAERMQLRCEMLRTLDSAPHPPDPPGLAH